MPKFSVQKAHGQDIEQAKVKVKAMVAEFCESYARIVSQVDWAADGRSAQATGKGFKADFVVDDWSVRVNVDLSLFATPLRGKVESKIREQLAATFGT